MAAPLTAEQIVALRSAKYGTDARVGNMILLAQTRTGAEMGDSYNEAVALLVLHLLTMDDRDESGYGAGGTLQREKEGSLERQYLVDFSLTKDQPDLSQTRWGMELLQLMKSCIFCPRTQMTEDV